MEPVQELLSNLRFKSIIVVPSIKKEKVIGTFLLRTASNFELSDSDRIYKICHLVANLSANALENAMLYESMKTAKDFFKEMSIHDGLTKLYTHKYFHERLEEEFSRSVRYEIALSIIFFDIDDFKEINDSFGHIAGDNVLQEIGKIIREEIRESDIAARYGGDEFAILVPNIDPSGALALAKKIRAIILNKSFKALDDKTCTVSIGVSSYIHGNLESSHQLVELADRAMYQSKHKGKDQVTFSDNPMLLKNKCVGT